VLRVVVGEEPIDLVLVALGAVTDTCTYKCAALLAIHATICRELQEDLVDGFNGLGVELAVNDYRLLPHRNG